MPNTRGKPKGKRYAEVTAKAKPGPLVSGEISTVDSSFYGRLQRYNPDELVGKKGLSIYRKMAVDEQVKAAIYTKMFAVLSSGWEIQAPKLPEEEEEIAAELREFVEWNFEEMEGHFDSKLQEALTALIYGYCLHGDTVIHTPSGDLPIRGLVGKQPWIFSRTDNEVKLVQAKRVWLSQKNAECIKITYRWWLGANGKYKTASIICTGDHPFQTIRGFYRKAKHLLPGDRLAPFSQQIKLEGGATRYRRKRAQLGIGKTWARRAPWIWRQLHKSIPPGYVIHHKDGNTLNDDPSNLECLSRQEHVSNHNKEWFYNASRKTLDSRRKKRLAICRIPEVRAKISASSTRTNIKTWTDSTIRKRRIEGMTGKKRLGQALANIRAASQNPERRRKISESKKRYWAERVSPPGNHEVISVAPYGCFDVYDIEVPDTNNFAANGVFVHNSVGEKVFSLIDYGKFAGKIGQKDLKFRRPESIEFACFSADTELLTKDGWKLVSVLSKADDVATLNPTTNELEYQKPTRFYRYPYRGQMLHQTGKHVDFLVTPNHRLWIKKSKDTTFRFVEAQSLVGGSQAKLSHRDIEDIKSARTGCPRNERGELYRRIAGRYGVTAKHIESVANGRFVKSRRIYDRAVYHVKRDCRWIGEERQFFTLPAVASERVFHTGTGRTETVRREYIAHEIQIPMDDWLRLFGIWLAEGCVYKAKKGANHKGDPTKPHSYTVSISQNVGPKLDVIKRWVEACGFNYSVRFSNPRHAQVVICDLRLFTYLEQFGKSRDKFIPQDLTELSSRQLRILYDAMMMGDGDTQGGYTSVSKRLADNVAELLLKIGYAATVHTTKNTRYEKNYGLKYRLHRSEGALSETACNIIANNARWVDYDGNVFCLEVPNHIVYARRNGKACWSGNSDEHGNLLDDGVVQTGKKLPKSKFLIYSYRKQFSNFYGQSDLREAYRCFSSDTEILTKEGWKSIQAVTKTDQLATLNPDTNYLEYHTPTRIYHYPYRGKMFHQSGRFVDQLVTPNHRLWAARSATHNYSKFRFIEVPALPKLYRVKRDCLWEGEERATFVLPAVLFTQRCKTGTGVYDTIVTREISAKQIPMDNWLQFLGIYLAEGNCGRSMTHPTKRSYIDITQNEGPKLEQIKSWVEACGFTYCIKKDRHGQKRTIEISSLQLYEYLKQFGKSHDKYLPLEVKALSRRQLNILLDAMILGDGSRDSSGSVRYATVSKKLADDVAEAAFKAGYAPTVRLDKSSKRLGGPVYILGLNRRNISATLLNEHADRREWIDYDGTVHCVEVPNHIVYVRRNGKACWSGNSWWLKDTILKYMSIGLERYGEPIADITHEGAITPSQRNNLENFAKNVQSRSGLIHDKKIELKFHNPGFRADVFITAINLYDTHLRIAILMPGLMGMAAEQQVGSLARSGTEFNVFLWIINQLRLDLETVVNEQDVKPLVDLNYEVTGGQYPKFKFREVDEEREAQIYDMWLAGLSSGALKKFPEDENKMRGTLGLAEKTDEDLAPEEPEFGPDTSGLFGGESGEEAEEELFEPERKLAKMSDRQLMKLLEGKGR